MKDTELTWIRLFYPKLIPSELIESVKGRTFTPEQFYAYQEEVKEWPGNFLYVLVDTNKVIQGYLWAEINNLDGSLFINTFSIRKEHWHKGAIIKRVTDFIADLKERTKAPRIYWITTNPKFFEKYGFHRSRNVLMEYNPDKQEKEDGTE